MPMLSGCVTLGSRPVASGRDQEHDAEHHRQPEAGDVDPDPVLRPEQREPQVHQQRGVAAAQGGEETRHENRKNEQGSKHGLTAPDGGA